MKYNGKRSLWWFAVLILYNLVFGWCIVMRDSVQGFWICMIFLALGDFFLFLFTVRNYVLLEKELMTVFLGFAKVTIDCKKITSIKKSKNPIASMALSLDRLKINYGNETIYVSVKNNDELIEALRGINPKIEV
jgi:hypothetical protein